MEVIRKSFVEGDTVVFEADIKDFFGSIDQDRFLTLVERRVSDPGGKRLRKRLVPPVERQVR